MTSLQTDSLLVRPDRLAGHHRPSPRQNFEQDFDARPPGQPVIPW
jgi:hypothetical protein